MLGIVIATHGTFSEGLLDACGVIIGETSNMKAICLKNGEDVNKLGDKIFDAINEVNSGDGVLVFVDLLSASPYNQSLMAINRLNDEIKYNTHIISGVNLPMLLEAINSQFLGIDASKAYLSIIEQAKASIDSFTISKKESISDEDDDF